MSITALDIQSRAPSLDDASVQTPASPTTPPESAGVAIPDGFELTEAGVSIIRDNDTQRIAGPIWVAAYTRDGQKTGWGLLVRWLDRDGHLHKRAIPIARLHEPGNRLGAGTR